MRKLFSRQLIETRHEMLSIFDRLFNTRTGTIRKHHQRGKISDDLRREALYLAERYRDKALMDNDYAADGYAWDMELEHIYAEAEKRLK